MVTYVISPGAWQVSGTQQPGSAGLSPPIRSGTSRWSPPIQVSSSPWSPPIRSGTSRWSPPIQAHGHGEPPFDPAELNPMGAPAHRLTAAAARLTVAAPWRGREPDWLYVDDTGSLLVEALNRSQAKVAYEGDSDRKMALQRGVAHGPTPENRLWRWGAEPRTLTVLADLHWRFSVKGAESKSAQLMFTRAKSVDSGTVKYETSMEISPVPKAWYDEQIDKVLRAAVEREDRLPEILSQAEDISVFFHRLAGLSPQTTPVTCALLDLSFQWAIPLVMALKHELDAPRPDVASTRILPVIDTPAHGAMPSGHATIAALYAKLLNALLFEHAGLEDHPRARQIDRLSRRIAFNRTVAGVHFPIDNRVGHALGLQLAAHFQALATGSQHPARYGMTMADGKIELREHGPARLAKLGPSGSRSGVGKSESLGAWWDKAREELEGRGLRTPKLAAPKGGGK